MKVSGSVKLLTNRILKAIKASSNEESDLALLFDALLYFAKKHEQVFEKSFERALSAKTATPVDPITLRELFEKVTRTVQSEKQEALAAKAKRDEELKELAKQSEIERLTKQRAYIDARLLELVPPTPEEETVTGEQTPTP